MHEPLKNCPFCGAPAHGYAIAPHSHSPAVLRLVPELPDHPGSYVIEGQCACGSGLIGAKESEVTARWNRRTPQPVAREPLTANQVSELANSVGYWHGDTSRADFINGIRYAEAAHGITQEGGSNAE